MTTLDVDDDTLLVDSVESSDRELIVKLKDGRRIALPLSWLPRLETATPQQRAKWRIMPFGDAIEWEDLDEHVSVQGLLRGKRVSVAAEGTTQDADAESKEMASRSDQVPTRRRVPQHEPKARVLQDVRILARDQEEVRLHVDADVLSWFKAQPNYVTRINAALRAYMTRQPSPPALQPLFELDGRTSFFASREAAEAVKPLSSSFEERSGMLAALPLPGPQQELRRSLVEHGWESALGGARPVHRRSENPLVA